MKTILLTFDYELSLGNKSGTVKNCMILPTNLILDLLKKHNAKAIFFVDTTYLLQLEKIIKIFPIAKKDFELIKNQIIRMADEGHYIYHHIHPHWLDAKYLENENQWDLSNVSKYTFYQTPVNDRENLLSESSRILNEILNNTNLSKNIDGFRAGGLYIEPFGIFKESFINNNVKYEFSVVPGLKKTDNYLFYDFTKAPKKPFYRFSENPSIEDLNGQFIQYPISQFQLKGILKILNGLYYRLLKLENDKFSDGLSVSSSFNNDDNQSNSSFFVSNNILSLELLNPIILIRYKQLIKQINHLHFLSHPKLMSYSSIKQFEKLLKSFSKNPNIEYDFKKF